MYAYLPLRTVWFVATTDPFDASSKSFEALPIVLSTGTTPVFNLLIVPDQGAAGTRGMPTGGMTSLIVRLRNGRIWQSGLINNVSVSK